MKRDEYFMREALALAKKGRGVTSPNPMVGALVVKAGRIISKGYHRRAGLAHAEVIALRKAGRKAKGATLYINLEPCCHWGRTPPCVDMVIASGIKRVVVAVKDPNPKVRGKSLRKLTASGMQVTEGVLKDEAKRLNEVFFKNVKEKLPFVAVKMAQSLDGKITTAGGESQWITDNQSRIVSKKMRDLYDAVLVGATTVIKDNPTLNGRKRIPCKVVVDPALRIPLGSYLVKRYAHKLIVFSRSKNVKKARLLKKKGVRIITLASKGRDFAVKKILKVLFSLNIFSVFVEGGAYTMGRFFDERSVDKMYCFIAPKIIGGKRALSSVGAKGCMTLKKAPVVTSVKCTRLNNDFLLWGYPRFCPSKK